MQCGDLDRYLEAFLDGRLGRSRGAILRRHLALCGACRARVERLRQFEREMQRRFRPLGCSQSMWHGLEVDLVASGRAGGGDDLLALPRALVAEPSRLSPAATQRGQPGPHPLRGGADRAPGRTSRMAGVLLVALALGALYQAGRTFLDAPDPASAALQAYGELTQAGRSPVLRSGDAVRVRDWLSAELGMPIPEPPAPEGFTLVGAERAALGPDPAGVVFYTAAGADGEPVLLFVQPLAQAETPSPPAVLPDEAAAPADDLRGFSWNARDFRFTLVGEQLEARLQGFID